MTACCVQKCLMSAFRISYLPHFQLSCSCWSDLTSRNLVAGEVTARAPRHYGSCPTTFLRPFSSNFHPKCVFIPQRPHTVPVPL